jgi:hypothetical protein
MAFKSTMCFALALFLTACSQKGPAQSAANATSTAQPATAAPASEPAAATSAPSGAGAPSADPAKPPAAQTQPGAAVPAAQPPVPEKPTLREITIPSGTPLSVKLTTPIASDTSKAEDQVRGTLAQPIVVDGETVVPAGATVIGSVLDAKESGRVKGRASIAFRFDRIIVADETHDIRTARVSREAAPNRKSDVKKGAIGAGAGALVGALIGGGKGAAIGAGVGGAGAVVATKGDEVRLPAGTAVSTKLQDPLKVLLPAK